MAGHYEKVDHLPEQLNELFRGSREKPKAPVRARED